MSTCDPFSLVDVFLTKLKQAQQGGRWAKAAGAGSRVDFPSTLEDMLECLVTGTADRAANNTYAGAYDPYDLDAFKERTRIIYDSVVQSAQENRDRITGNLAHSSDTSLATAGIWLSGQVAETFHGLVVARSRQLQQDSSDLAPLLDRVGGLADDLDVAVSQIPQDAGVTVSEDARLLAEQTCPQALEIAAMLRQISADVASSKNLGASYCGATSLLEKIRAMIASLPPRAAQAIARAFEVNRQLLEAVATADAALARIKAGKDIIPAFDTQIEQANFVPISEKEIHSALADQFESLCADIQAMRAAHRDGEMQTLIPRAATVGAISLDIIGSGPGERVNTVRGHPAAPFYEGYVDRLNLIEEVEDLTNEMDDMQADLMLSVYHGNGRVKERISEIKDSIAAVESFRREVEAAAGEYQDEVQNLVDGLCVGALTRLLAMSGYQEIEDKFLNGLFGEIPRLAQESATTIGQLVQCLQEFTAGACRTFPDSGAQRFALERLTDVTAAAARVQDFVGETGSRIQGARDSMTGTLDRLANAIQQDVRSAIGAPPLNVPADSVALPKNFSISAPNAPASPRTGAPSAFDCAFDISTDADGFLKATNPFALPPGVTLDPSGYLKHDGVEALPAGTYRAEGGYLKKLPDVPAPGRSASVLPAARAAAPRTSVFAPQIIH